MQEETNFINLNLSQMSCREIFQALSDTLGEHYKNKGLKYSRSSPKLVYKDTQIKLEICFWSSRSNMPGNFICFDVIPSFYSVKLKNIKNKGLICSHTDVFRCYNQSQKQKYSFNVCNLNADEIDKITTLIDNAILPWIEKLKTPDGVIEMHRIKKEGYKGNSVFLEYVQLYYPEMITG